MSIIDVVKQHILEQYLQGEDAALLTESSPLISGGVLDSLNVLELVSFLERRFHLELEAHEADQAHLDTLSDIAHLVARKLRQQP
ncbi:MAG: acyl carrier protein [Gemmatimonadaceae bacterium]|nr:acyl carrier protein [Gemmatimonadaceae bacterium]